MSPHRPHRPHRPHQPHRPHLPHLLGLLGLLAAGLCSALDNGLARTPPMGWMAWERFVCNTDCRALPELCVSQQMLQEMATRMAQDGFRQLGYQYLAIDDCWALKERDAATGRLQADPDRFENGSLLPLATFVHRLGLKLGTYGDCGTKTCQGYPGQLANSANLSGNHFQLDADQMARWQVDSFKFDACWLDVSQSERVCPHMGDALNQTGRPILFSCSWPAYQFDMKLATNWTLAAQKCNMWRFLDDIFDSWDSILLTVDNLVRMQSTIAAYHGPGHWFDADQLVLGNFGLSAGQERAQMAIWSIWSVPLYMGNDLRAISNESSQILRNRWLIRINQDPMGILGLMVHQQNGLQVFAKPIEPIGDHGCPDYAVLYLLRANLGGPQPISVQISTILRKLHKLLKEADPNRWSDWTACSNLSREFKIHDLFDDFKELGQLKLATDKLNLKVDPSSVRAVQLVESK